MKLFAPAKLTWFLEITGVRADGYHELRSEMTTLDFGDDLEVTDGEDFFEVIGAPSLVADETNLVRRALRLVRRRAGVRITKRIPVGGGLGGGSADAGAILRWAGGVDDAVALTLGGDVPFCQHGGRALVTGVGEHVRPLAYDRREVTLLVLPFSVSTPAVYQAYDELTRSGEILDGVNHLAKPAQLVEPRLATAVAWARSEFGDVRLAGSGATLFVEGHVGASAGADVQSPVGSVRVIQTVTTP